MKAKPADFGPKEQRHRVVIRDRADPDAPNVTIRRAEVRVIYHVWWARGELSDAQHEAADRLAIAWEALQGSSCGMGTGGSGSPFGRMPISQRQIQAAEDIRLAREALGEDFADVVSLAAMNQPAFDAQTGRRLFGTLARMWKME
jgi:hypothetical protein